MVERDRKLQIPAFVWAFVFGFAAAESRTLPGFRRCYNSTADELLFCELKTQYELDEFDTSDKHVVNILLCAALLSLLVSRDLLDLISEQADDELVFPTERWAALFRPHAQLTIHELGEYLGYSSPPLLERLIEDAQKIHKQRPILQETLATATQPRCEA